MILHHFYELLAPLGPEWSAILCGFVVLGADGRFYLTPSGEEYLAQIEDDRCGA